MSFSPPKAPGIINTIVNFFEDKGLSGAAIAGILGNMRVESNFNTGALNSNEGAIGLVQWEGGRRTALQQFAAARGTSETDLTTQLNFIWHELTTSETGVLNALRNVSSPAEAAAIWDGQYERSSGSTRDARVQSAQSFYSSGLQSDGGSYGGTGSGPGGGSSGSYSGGGGNLTPAQYEQALGQLSGILNAVPELKSLLNHAVSTHQTTEDFVNAVQNSHWYRSHSDTFRSVFSLYYSDPAEYTRQRDAVRTSIAQQAAQLGVHLDQSTIDHIAHTVLFNGLDSQATTQQIVAHYVSGGNASGQAATIQGQLQQLASQYGVPVTSQWIQNYTQRILSNYDSIDGAKQNLISQASSLYPALTQQLKAGQTTQDVAQPYIAQMAQTLEIDPNSINLNDPTIKKALTYQPTDPKGNTTGQQQLLPLWQFENNLRQDPRWDQTDNAKQSAFQMLHQLGQSFGFAS